MVANKKHDRSRALHSRNCVLTDNIKGKVIKCSIAIGKVRIESIEFCLDIITQAVVDLHEVHLLVVADYHHE